MIIIYIIFGVFSWPNLEEVYFNKARRRKTKTKRYSTNVLEAILRTKNFHLARMLFDSIPEQEKTENLKKYISVIKSQEIWGMPELQLAYKNFIELWQAFYNIKNLHDRENMDTLNRLFGCIGRVLKEHLPWFSIYLFCHPDTHADADYTKAPNWTCILWDQSELDLDSFGGDSYYALCKGGADGDGGLWFGWAGRRGWCASGDAEVDSKAFSSQCKVLSLEMDKTIKLYSLDEPKPEPARNPSFG